MKKFTLQLLLSVLMMMGFALNADAQVLNEDFESGVFPPTDWSTDLWNDDPYGYSGPNNGSGYAYTYQNNNFLASPAILITGADNTLSFWARVETVGNPQDLDVFITTDLADYGTADQSFNITSDTYAEYTVDMSSYDGQTVYIVFVRNSTSTEQMGISIDDLLVEAGGSNDPSADATLSDLTVDAVTVGGFASDDYEYDVELAFGTTVYPTVAYVLNDATASATQTDDSAFPGSSIVSVTAEDGTTMLAYTINFTVAAVVSMETDILSFDFPTFTSGSATTIDIAAKTVNVEVINGTSLTDLVAEFTLSTSASAKVGTTDQVSGTTINDFSSPITYAVTAQDGTTSTDWTVTVTVAAAVSTDATLSDLTVNGTTVTDFDPATIEYNVTLPTGTTAIPVVAGILSDANATKIEVQATDLAGDLAARTAVVLVTAEDGSTIIAYSIIFTVDVAASTDATLTDLTVNGTTVASFAPDTYIYYFELPMGTTELPTVMYTLSDQNATAVQTDITAYPGDATIVVTSEDGNTELTYTITLTVATGINTVINEKDITVYPNPSNGQFNIALNLNVNTVNIEVVNMQGQVVSNFNKIEATTTQTVDLSNLCNGMYYIKISSDKSTIVKKVNIIK